MSSLFSSKNTNAPWKKYYEENAMNINIPDESVYNYFEKKALYFGNRHCIDYYGNKIRYNEFLKMIDECAKGLYASGVGKGDIVTVCLPNTIEGIVSFFAINKIGAIVNFIHPASSENEIKNSLNNTDSKVLIVVDTNYIKIKNIEKSINIKKIILVNIFGYISFFAKIRGKFENKIKISKKDKLYTYWNFFLSNSQKLCLDNYIVNSSSSDPAIILHSGGTTGTPKGVVLSNSNLIAYVEISMIAQSNFVAGDVFLTVMPIFHSFGIIHSVLFPLCIGMFVVLRVKFEVKEYCKSIIKYKPQMIAGVPTIFESVLEAWNKPNIKLDFLKCVLVAGDTLKPSLREKINIFLANHNSNIRVIEGYGLSECSGGVVHGINKVEKFGTTGIPLPGIYVGIFSEKNEELPYGKEGEICVCGPTVMLGYYNNEKETNLVLKVHKDGKLWLHTGDLGKMDEDGFVTYTSRLKRMIVSSGYNIYPNMIEGLLESHPAVLACCVVGIPHKYKMEVAKAVIVLKEGYNKSDLLISEFKKMCSKNLPKYSWPYKYEFRDKLPTTKVGKIDYKKMKEEEDEDLN